MEGEVVEALQKRFQGRLAAVILFGSQAQGRKMPDSDIDLLVVVSNLTDEAERSLRPCLEGIMVRHQTPIETVVVTEDELGFMLKNRLPLALGVLLGHEVLYDRIRVQEVLRKAEEEITAGGGRKYARSGLWVIPKQ